jgi:K+-transporting ATPase ATPase C chain
MRNWLKDLKTSLLAVLSLAVILCGVYPLTTWVLSHGLFPARADGSFISRDPQTKNIADARNGNVIGSVLIGQRFLSPRYFHPRPSAAGEGYDAAKSGGSNLGPLSKSLIEAVRERVAAYREENGLPDGTPVPADAVTASGSGLDPHISPENARLQAPRVARKRGLEEAAVRRAIEAATEGRTLGVLGEPRVNVLRLNLALDGLRDAGR